MGASSISSCAMRFVGSYFVCVHSNLAPTNTEWAEVLRVLRNHPDLGSLRILVYTDGGAPNAAQRSDLSSLLANRNIPIAVITTSVIARAAGTALTWLNPGFRVFPPTEFDKALDHLGATGMDKRTLRDSVEELRRELAKRFAVVAG